MAFTTEVPAAKIKCCQTVLIRLKFREGTDPMTTVHEVLERLGKPPLEVCLDWAWQLEHLNSAQLPQVAHSSELLSQSTSSAVPASKHPPQATGDLRQTGGELGSGDSSDSSDSSDDSDGDWSQLSLDEHGQLHWLIGAAASPASPASPANGHPARLAQLLRWTSTLDSPQPDQAAAATPTTAQLQSQLIQRTLQWARSHNSTVPLSQARTSSTLATATRASRSSRAVPVGHKPRIKRRRLRYLVATVSAGGLLLGVITTLSLGVPSTTATNSPPASGAADASRAAGTSRAAPASIFEAAAVEATAQQDLAVRPAPEDLLRFGDTVAESSVPPATEQYAEQNSALQPLSLSTDSVDFRDPMHSADNRDAEGSIDGRVAEDGVRSIGTDVLAELAALSKSAEATTSETKIPSPEPTVAEPASAPLLLQSFPMIQLQEFDKRLRPRQPQWRLRLTASEGLEIVPSDVQQVSEGQLIRWTIRAAEPSQPLGKNYRPFFTRDDRDTTSVVVQVQLPSKRTTSLGWRIWATSDEYPQTAVPLDRAWLDRFQEYLNHYIAGLQQESQRSKEMSHAAGLPSQTRSALSARGRALNSERKRAADLLEIVADANQMVGWLDGQIEVHGELVDTAANPPTSLLQFGSP